MAKGQMGGREQKEGRKERKKEEASTFQQGFVGRRWMSHVAIHWRNRKGKSISASHSCSAGPKSCQTRKAFSHSRITIISVWKNNSSSTRICRLQFSVMNYGAVRGVLAEIISHSLSMSGLTVAQRCSDSKPRYSSKPWFANIPNLCK